jgi:hypothetical protein
MSKLYISDDLSLPANAITQTFAILGIRGSGKTNTAVVMFEEMVKQGDQCVVLDPTDAWYGVRSSADGKSPGLQVYVFGGEHGDLPLEGTYGSQMADFVIDSGASVVFSLRHLSMADQRRFAADFGERLRFLKARPENRNPLQIFLDEAEEFVPQNIRESDPNTARMFGAYNRMVRRDRNLGLGITLISQRPQSVNKEPLSQIETLICHRLLHKLDRKSVKESWVEGHDTAGIGEKFLDSLASLERGDVWVWSPFWLDIFKKIHIRHRETFDSSATPKTGERQKVVKVRAEVDLNVLRQKLAETIDKAKNSDPTYLRRRILELEKALKAQPSAATTAPSSADLDKAYEAGRRDLLTQIKGVRLQLDRDAEKFSTASTKQTFQDLPNFFQAIFSRMKEIAAMLPGDAPVARPVAPTKMPATAAAVRDSRAAVRPAPQNINGNDSISRSQLRVLSRLVELLECTQQSSVKKEQLAAWAEYSPTSGGYNNLLGSLRTAGLIDYPQPGMVHITDAGRAIAQPESVPITSDEMREHAKRVLGGSEAKLLDILHRSREVWTKEQLGQESGFSHTSGGFNNYLGHMRTLGFVEYPAPGQVKAADWLYL